MEEEGIKKEILGMFVGLLVVATTIPTVESLRNNAINSTITNTYQTSIETCWTETQKLLIADGTTKTFFGYSVSFFVSLNINQCLQKKAGLYSTNGQNLSMLEPGDIAFKRPDWFPYALNHCLLYIGYNDSTERYVFIEAYGVGDQQVQYRYENESTLTGSLYGPFAKVRHANNTQKQNAIDFAKRQLGKPFQRDWINKNNNPEDTTNDSLAGEWYCSELVWAAYYNCNNPFPEEEPEDGYVYGAGIDLDRNGWEKNLLNITTVHPLEILFNLFEVRVYRLKNILPITCGKK
jgi:hypothetical protein